MSRNMSIRFRKWTILRICLPLGRRLSCAFNTICWCPSEPSLNGSVCSLHTVLQMLDVARPYSFRTRITYDLLHSLCLLFRRKCTIFTKTVRPVSGKSTVLRAINRSSFVFTLNRHAFQRYAYMVVELVRLIFLFPTQKPSRTALTSLWSTR